MTMPSAGLSTWVGRVPFVALALTGTALLGCGSAVPGAAKPDASPAVADVPSAGDVAVAPACVPIRRRPNGTCCPSGTFFDAAQKDCKAAGPTGCPDAFEHPAACWPHWCFAFRTDALKPCPPATPGCRILPLLCADPAPDLRTCPAGWYPERTIGEACVPAGAWWPGDPTPTFDPLAPLPPLPMEAIPPGTPPLGELPPPELTRMCRGADGAARPCQTGESGCLPGQVPDPDSATGCLAFGAPWCPEGFVAAPAKPGRAPAVPGCVPDPGECGLDPFGGIAAGSGALFVDPAAKGPGTGTRTDPWPQLVTALVAAGVGQTIALAAGTHTLEDVVANKPFTLHGRCAALVTIHGPGPVAFTLQQSPELLPTAPPFVLRGVTLAGNRAAVRVDKGGRVRLERVWVDRPLGAGLIAAGPAELVALDSVVAGTRADASGAGFGVHASGAAVVRFERVRVADSQGIGIAFEGPAQGELGQVVVSGTRAAVAKGAAGIGMFAGLGAQVQVRSARITDNTLHGLLFLGPVTRLDAAGLLVDGTLAGASGLRATGLSALDDATLVLRGVRLHANADTGLLLKHATLLAHGLVIDATLAVKALLGSGAAMTLTADAQADISGLRIHDARSVGLAASLKSHVTLRGATIDGVAGDLTVKSFGGGVFVDTGATLEFERLRIHSVRTVGLADRDNATVRGRYLAIEHVLPPAPDKVARLGITSSMASHVYLEGVRIRALEGAALVATDRLGNPNTGELNDPSTVGVLGLAVDDIRPSVQAGEGTRYAALAYDGGEVLVAGGRFTGAPIGAVSKHSVAQAWGVVSQGNAVEPDVRGAYGGWAFLGGRLEVIASLFRANHAVGLYGYKAHLSAFDSVVRDTRLAELSATGLSEAVTAGDAIVAHQNLTTNLARCLVHGHDRVGVLVDATLGAKLAGLIITGGGIGFATQGRSSATTAAHAVWGHAVLDVATDTGLALPPPPKLVEVGDLPKP